MAAMWTRRGVVGAAVAVAAGGLGLVAQAADAVTAPATLPAGNAAVPATPAAPAVAAVPLAKGGLTEETLGSLLKALGIDAKLTEKRYDFAFKTVMDGAEWELSMSSVLSADGGSIWIMAWLDQLPKSAADVPRTALLRLLAENDKLGKGKFFAYIASNRRFVLQRVIPNEAITSKAFREALDDLGADVVATHPVWSVSVWNATTTDPAAQGTSGAQVRGSAPQAPAGVIARPPVQQAAQPAATAPATTVRQ